MFYVFLDIDVCNCTKSDASILFYFHLAVLKASLTEMWEGQKECFKEKNKKLLCASTENLPRKWEQERPLSLQDEGMGSWLQCLY